MTARPDTAGDAADDAAASDAALAVLERWLGGVLDDPASDEAPAYAAELRALAGRSLEGDRLENLATLVADVGASLAATQRRAVRTGYDLHDGAIQHVLVTGLELQSLRRDLEDVPEPQRQKPLERLSIVLARLLALENDLRDLAHSLETPSRAEVPLAERAFAEIAAFEQETAITTDVHVSGDFEGTTRSQRIAVVRVLQGALANVRRHSGAQRVKVELVGEDERIELRVEDDGRGFDAAAALADSARRGRLGLVSMSERVRLLGGEFDLDSRPGGPTRVSISLYAPPKTDT
jgi:signal transduction histidine kinase